MSTLQKKPLSMLVHFLFTSSIVKRMKRELYPKNLQSVNISPKDISHLILAHIKFWKSSQGKSEEARLTIFMRWV